MRGIGLLVYVIFFTVIFLVNRQAFLSIAVNFQGVPAKLSTYLNEITTDLSSKNTVSLPQGYEVFFTNCDVPSNENLDGGEFQTVNSNCKEGVSVICLFYSFYDSDYRMCKRTLKVFDKQYYFDGEEAKILLIERDEEDDNRISLKAT